MTVRLNLSDLAHFGAQPEDELQGVGLAELCTSEDRSGGDWNPRPHAPHGISPDRDSSAVCTERFHRPWDSHP